jgi:hypothetical protein
MSDTDNRIEAVLPAADKDAVLTAITTIKTKLPFLVDLAPEEKRVMLKLGGKSLDFVTKALEVAMQNPDFLPRSFNVDEMKKDVELLQALVPIMVALDPLYDLINDTYMLVGSEAYAAGLEVYRYAKQAKHSAGLDPLIDALGKKFARKSAASDPTPTPSESAT